MTGSVAMPDLAAKPGQRAAKPRLLYLVTEDWYFCSHRMELARAARDSGYEVMVATHVCGHGTEITGEGFKLIPIQLSRKTRDPVADLADFFELVGIYRKERPDIVHHVGMKPILYGSWAARFVRRTAVVNSFAGLGYVFTSTKFSTRILRKAVVLLLKGACKGSSRMSIFQNQDDLRTFRACGVATPDNTTIVRGSGVADEKFVPTPEAPDAPVVLLAGRVLADKGVGEFAEAAALIQRLGIKARFVLAGREDTANPTSIPEAQLRKWQAAGIIEWWGQRDDMPAVLAQSHIVVLPSYREGLPKILLEAAASGRPVVATDVPGCREIVRDGENGFLVPVKDPNALAGALVKLIENPALRSRMVARGREIVESGLTSRQIVPQILAVYASLLRKMRPAN